MTTQLLTQGTTRRRSHISLTPLIDVVFILLLFFMLSSTFAPITALDLSAKTQGAGVTSPKIEVLIIGVISKDQWSIEEQTLALKDQRLRSRLERAKTDEQTVLVQAEANASVQDLVSALSFLQSQGITQLNLSPSSETSDDR